MKKSDEAVFHRRALLASAGRAVRTLAAANTLRACPNILAGSATLWPITARGQTGDELVQPEEIRSRNGVLDAALTAAPGTVRLGGFTFPGMLYNGSYLPPLLRACTGDVLRIAFKNGLSADPSNLHFHGMSVSPKGNSDNVFVHVHPGEEFKYEVQIPARGRQGPGLFWYHPHAHGYVFKQMLGGMSGGLVIDGLSGLFSILQGLPERFLFIKHVELAECEVVSINGQINPVIPIKPGEIQFWRLAHIGATLFIKYRIEGMPLYAIATDGHPLSRPRRMTDVFIGPGERIDALVIGPAAGEYAMQTVPFQNQAWRAPDPAQQIATIVASGGNGTPGVLESEIMGQRLKEPRWIGEVRAAPVAHHRALSYSRTEDRQIFMIDGRVMEENRIDQTVKLGDTEEWTIVNTDQQYHSFHIHQTPFLVTEINGVPQDMDSLRDTFSVPPATEIGPGSLTVKIPFTDPVIAGKFVYHCHAVDHEDKGMMGVIKVAA
jgi:FtsP/CotA-like multicopper oxidase with cupredoxin domain